ncbi:MAG: LysR family transcriptional regulator [Idiomarina sp.]|nr:LysR family transcriptional regulator [Idiomarina sp.]MCL5049975.1 LysR family transcriptional regulator [Bacillota bacterium]
MKQWQGISEFVAVAEHASFTQAAKWLGMSVAQVSRNVNELEQRLQVRLFYRSTRQVRLSEEGRVYLQHCQHLVQGLDDANRALSNLQQSPQGRLRITAPVFYGETVIAPLLNEFLCQHPDLQLDMDLTNQRLDLIEGRFDLAIRLGHLDDSSMIARKLGQRSHHLVASPEYLARYGEPDSPDTLRQHRLLSGTMNHWRLANPKHTGELNVRPHKFWRCNSGVALLDAVRRGMGIAQLPDYYVQQDIAQGHLRAIMEAYRPSDDGIWALYPQNRHLSPKVRSLLDFLLQRLQQSAG